VFTPHYTPGVVVVLGGSCPGGCYPDTETIILCGVEDWALISAVITMTGIYAVMKLCQTKKEFQNSSCFLSRK